jgi:hypothetical protein
LKTTRDCPRAPTIQPKIKKQQNQPCNNHTFKPSFLRDFQRYNDTTLAIAHAKYAETYGIEVFIFI